MPSVITHYIFADENAQNMGLKVNRNYYIFSQSHDILFFDPSKDIRFLGHYAHKHNTQRYILSIIEYIKKNNLKNNKDCMSYLYGIISHYTLDSVTHPFIFYKSGKSQKKHREIERNIDALMYEKYYKKPFRKCNIARKFIPRSRFSKELRELINHAYYETYNFKNISTKLQTDILNERAIYRITSKDQFGIKYNLYKLFNKNHMCLSTFNKSDIKYLNLTHQEWNHPCDKKETYNFSFTDLYNQSSLRFETLIEKITLYLQDEISLDDLKEHITDISYLTGKEISENKKMNYFE